MGLFDDLAAHGSRLFFDTAESTFRTLGLSDAAANLRRYRSAQGGTLKFTDDQIAKHEPILEAEDTNRTRFESATFVGKTKRRKDINDRLHNLRDGETYTFEDRFKRPMYGNTTESQVFGALADPTTYFAFGRGDILSSGEFTAQRNGQDLLISGSVKNSFDPDQSDNLFDFNRGQSGNGPASILERQGEAKPFRMQFSRRQNVEAKARYGPNGELTLGSVIWGNIR